MLPSVVTPLRDFLLTEGRCPPAWRPFDLYLFRDEAVVFYVGQSYVAFDRVWQHILDGYKGRSVVGRFLLCNWPASLRFTIELLSSRSEPFTDLGHDLNAAERRLIEDHRPCFNVALNAQPTPLPAAYAPPGQQITCPRGLNKLINQARIVAQVEARRRWVEESEMTGADQ